MIYTLYLLVAFSINRKESTYIIRKAMAMLIKIINGLDKCDFLLWLYKI